MPPDLSDEPIQSLSERYISLRILVSDLLILWGVHLRPTRGYAMDGRCSCLPSRRILKELRQLQAAILSAVFMSE